MTSADHSTGSARVAEAAAQTDADIIINLQGDEPEIEPAHIDLLARLVAEFDCFASTLACRFAPDAKGAGGTGRPFCGESDSGREAGAGYLSSAHVRQRAMRLSERRDRRRRRSIGLLSYILGFMAFAGKIWRGLRLCRRDSWNRPSVLSSSEF